MKKTFLTLSLLIALYPILISQKSKAPDWENPEVISINKEAARST